jgi:hypothetical protein
MSATIFPERLFIILAFLPLNGLANLRLETQTHTRNEFLICARSQHLVRRCVKLVAQTLNGYQPNLLS